MYYGQVFIFFFCCSTCGSLCKSLHSVSASLSESRRWYRSPFSAHPPTAVSVSATWGAVAAPSCCPVGQNSAPKGQEETVSQDLFSRFVAFSYGDLSRFRENSCKTTYSTKTFWFADFRHCCKFLEAYILSTVPNIRHMFYSHGLIE